MTFHQGTLNILPKNSALKHIALKVNQLDDCEAFYHQLGLRTELKTDDYVYITGNGDNISLHRVIDSFNNPQRLVHFGFALDSIAAVNELYERLKKPILLFCIHLKHLALAHMLLVFRTPMVMKRNLRFIHKFRY